MQCILCVSDKENVIPIFNEEGFALNINEIITKHFWLEPNANDPNASVICRACWKPLSCFHEFYLQIVEAHCNQLEIVDEIEEIKSENLIHDFVGLTPNDLTKLIASNCIASEIKIEIKEEYDNLPNENDCKVADYQVNQTPSAEFRKDEAQPAKPTINLKCVDVRKLLCDPITTQLECKKEDNKLENIEPYEINLVIKQDIKTSTEPQPKKKKKQYPKKKVPKPPPPKKYRSSGVQHLNAQRMREFEQIIANYMEISCAICNTEGITYSDFGALDRHFRAEHNQCGYLVCCNKKFNKRYLVVDHILTHQNPEYFKCEKCGKVSIDRKCLKAHMRLHDIERKRTFKCEKCPFRGFTKPALLQHMQLHITERNIQCPKCDKFFPTQDKLQAHIKVVHEESHKIICEKCGKAFNQKETFQRHMLQHDGIINLIPCELCGLKLTSKSGVVRHMQVKHPKDNETHECSQCGKVKNTARALQHHVWYNHKAKKKHECTFCDKKFKMKKFLKEHMTTHTGEVLYTCPHCPKTFNSNANMHSHRKKMHRKEWEENRRHPHLGTSANAKANAEAAAAAAAAAAAEENNQQ